MKYLFIISTILFCNVAYSQTNFGFTEGTIVYKRGDSILCLLKREVNYGDVITYKTHQNAEESQVGSKYIKSIRMESKYLENIILENKEKLVTLIVAGKISLYNYVETQKGEPVKIPNTGGGMFAPIKVITHYIIKDGDKFQEIKEKSFKKTLNRLLPDCQLIITKIENNEYSFDDIPEIIKEYNTCKN